MEVDLDDTWIGRDGERVQTRIDRRLFALEDHRHAQLCCGAFDCRQQIEVVLCTLDGRHEDMQTSVSRLDAQRRANDAGIGDAALRGLVRLKPDTVTTVRLKPDTTIVRLKPDATLDTHLPLRQRRTIDMQIL